VVGLTYGSYSFDNVYFNTALNSVGTSGQIGFDTINSWLGRAGANFGGTFLASDNLALAPFVHGSVWHEFVGPSTASSTVFNGGSAFNFGVSTERVGTFGQVGVGLQFKVLDLDFLGFVRGDIRFGSNIQGQALNIGFKKQF
jgi:outer membrane autotransporter protein